MANHASALKRIRQNQNRKLRNRYYARTMRNALKQVLTSTDKKEVTEMSPTVISMIDKLAKKNVIHKNKAANLKSQVHKHLNTV